MMYYRISKNEKNLFFGKKNRPGVGSDLNTVFVIHYTKDIQTESEIHFRPYHIVYIFCFLQEF